MRTSGVMICVPAYQQQVSAQTMQSLVDTTSWLVQNKIRTQMSWISAADIVEVRNLFLTTWYDGCPDFSHLIMVDADMGFPPELVRDYLRFDKPLLGCLYARRQMEVSVVGGALHENHTIDDVVNGFLPACYVGGGLMMIQRGMVKTLIERKPEIVDALPGVLANATPIKINRLLRAFDPIKSDNHRLSEDVSFCHRWIECGGEIWANVSHRISHVGPFDFAIRYGGVLESKAAAEKVAA